MRIPRSSRIAALVAVIGTSLALAVPQVAAAQQTGLVNIDISGNTVQVPVAVAANICDVTVAVLVADLRDDGRADCDADADGTATAVRPGGGGAQGPPA